LKRRQAEDSNGLTKFLNDMENVLLETDNGGATQVAYTLEPQIYGNLISQRRAGATSQHHFDGLGSTDRLTDSGESVLASYIRTAFGVPKLATGNHPNRYTYIGRMGYRWEPDAQQYDVRRRRQDPARGDWLNPDPLHFGINWYAYVHNSPGRLNDPSGQVAPALLLVLVALGLPWAAVCGQLGYWAIKIWQYGPPGSGYDPELAGSLGGFFETLAILADVVGLNNTAYANRHWREGNRKPVKYPFEFPSKPGAAKKIMREFRQRIREMVAKRHCDDPIDTGWEWEAVKIGTLAFLVDADVYFTFFNYGISARALAKKYLPCESQSGKRIVQLLFKVEDRYDFHFGLGVQTPCVFRAEDEWGIWLEQLGGARPFRQYTGEVRELHCWPCLCGRGRQK